MIRSDAAEGITHLMPRSLFGETSVFGDREAFCLRIVEAINEGAAKENSPPVFVKEDTAQATLKKLSKTGLLRAAGEYGVSLDRLAPLTVSAEVVDEWRTEADRRNVRLVASSGETGTDKMNVKIMLQIDALDEVCGSTSVTKEAAEKVEAARRSFQSRCKFLGMNASEDYLRENQ